MFWEKFVWLCNVNGKTPNAIAKELNIPSGSITAWKKGAMPRSSTVKRISEYFNVDISELIGNKESGALQNEGSANREEEFLSKLRRASPKIQQAIWAILESAENKEE